VRIGPAEDDPGFAIAINADGRVLFKWVVRMSGAVCKTVDPDVALIQGRGSPYSAASLTCRSVGVRIVTSSSAAVGCSAMVASKSALVAFIFTAMATT
jgi:hypothetical protein